MRIDIEKRIEKAQKEHERKEREEQIKTIFRRDPNLNEVDLFLLGEQFEDYTTEYKYVLWKLHKLDKEKDAELYWMMMEAYHVEWEPTYYQKNTEVNLLEGIRDSREMFGMVGLKYDYNRFSAGDVLMFYAEELSRDIDCSLAFALELYFKNLGLPTKDIIMSDRYSATIYQVLNDFLVSDLEPAHATIFDPATYARGSYYVEIDDCWDIPAWWDQYQEFLKILQPVMQY